MKYIFDVDGTLTPSRGSINSKFEKWFLEFIQQNEVYLATGSDYPKTVEQLGKEICESVKTCFNCSGNSVWKNGVEIRRNEWQLEDLHRDFLESKLSQSKFHEKTGNHIEERPGMVNFSIVGRNASLEERFLYRQWDEHKNERVKIAIEFNQTFGNNIVVQVAGETGLDIYPKGYDKSQIAVFVKGPTIFFGDKMLPDGNDFPLAQEIMKRTGGRAIQVRDWEDTWKRIKSI